MIWWPCLSDISDAWPRYYYGRGKTGAAPCLPGTQTLPCLSSPPPPPPPSSHSGSRSQVRRPGGCLERILVQVSMFMHTYRCISTFVQTLTQYEYVCVVHPVAICVYTHISCLFLGMCVRASEYAEYLYWCSAEKKNQCIN